MDLTIVVVHELTPAVSGTTQHVVETLIVLHQIRENMFLTVLEQVFHLCRITLYALVCIVRELIVRQLTLQDIGAELLGRPTSAILR